jgi:hypothetical protein
MQVFISGCSATYQQSGATAEAGNAYCECMARKLEKKYTFNQANRLTVAELQTPEWQQEARDCQSGNDY